MGWKDNGICGKTTHSCTGFVDFDDCVNTVVRYNGSTQYLSIDCFLKASAMSVLTVVQSGVAMTVPIGVWVPAAVLDDEFVSIRRLGALPDRVSPLCGSLPRLHPSNLVDVDLGLWRVLNVDVHQGWVERHCRRSDRQFKQYSL